MNTIYIHKGDSTIFADVQKFLTFSINTELDLTGWQAIFMLGSVIKEVADISSKKFDIILTQQETSKLWYGDCCGCIKLIDANGNTKTVCNKIPFSITNQVVENNQEVVNLDIPNSCEIDIELFIGAPYDDTKTVKSVNGQTGDVIIEIPDTSNLATKDELNEKQDKGDYALKAEIPSLEGLINEQQLEQGLNAKQDKGDYALVSDIPSLDDCVKTTDVATSTKNGIVKANGSGGIKVNSAGNIATVLATNEDIDEKEHLNKVIVPANLNYAVNSVLPTMTQAEYDALETKDENLFYMIVEG